MIYAKIDILAKNDRDGNRAPPALCFERREMEHPAAY